MSRDNTSCYDVVIIGGGVIGCGTARALALRQSGLKICLLEKEPELALHQSGRNSGVVHVGYNQKPGTLKARFVVEGSRRLREYCRGRGVTVVEDGILVLARDSAEEATLEVLRQRAEQNGAEVRHISRSELAEREPEATATAALLAPRGASFDSRSYVLALAEDARQSGVEVRTNQTVRELSEEDDRVRIGTGSRSLDARLVINCAGLHADRIAQQLGVGRDLRIVPFLGFYSELIPERRGLVRSHLYPAPDLEFPFLGVHLSRTFDGRVLVGPGSSLALGREAYERGAINAMNLVDLVDTFTYPGFLRLLGKPRFRQLVRQEWKKSVSRRAVAEEARHLLPAIRDEDLTAGRGGIRAQLVDMAGNLVDDLRIERTARSIHVLNAVSPALTCSLPFADHLANLALESF
jgi:L-2-hydroxyglutarate oxidase